MTIQFDAVKKQQLPSIAIGRQSYLDINTPLGLFEACNGNRYIVVDDYYYGDDDLKYAVVLRHPHFKNFSLIKLTRQPLEYGTRRDSYRLRLTNFVPDDGSKDKPGEIGIYERWVNIACRDGKRGTHMVPIGDAGQLGLDIGAYYNDAWCHFDAWAIEFGDTHSPFCERSPAGERTWLIDVQPLPSD